MMWPLVVIALVVVGLAGRTALQLVRRNGAKPGVVQNGLDGLLFWGLLAVLFGILGQVVGYFKGFSSLAAHGMSSPVALMMGLAECLIPTIAGCFVLALAGALWFVLRWRFRCLNGAVRPR